MFLLHCVVLVFSYSAQHILVGTPQKSVNKCKGDEAISVGESQPEEIVLISMDKGKSLKVFDFGMKKLLEYTDF